MNKTIKSCIEDLNMLAASLKTISNDTERGAGINLAIELAKESINTRIQILSDFIDGAKLRFFPMKTMILKIICPQIRIFTTL